MVAFSDYPERRSAWIYEFKQWHGQLTDLARHLVPDANVALMTAICLGAGSVEPDTTADRQQLVPAFEKLYRQHPQAAVHAAARFALTKWNVELPTVTAPKDAEWIATDLGFNLVRIRPGAFVRSRFTQGSKKDSGQQLPPEHQMVTIQKPFLAGDREVSVELFYRFFDDPDWPEEQKPKSVPVKDPETGKTKVRKWSHHLNISRYKECPVQQVNFDDAILFCNWLSHREGLQPCYKPRSAKRNEPSRWSFDTSANGYRLPTESEWEYFARAGTRTFWHSGQDEVILTDYVAGIRNCDYGTKRCGSMFPSPWGLFDTHGNVREWCWDWNVPWPANTPAVVAGTGPDQPQPGKNKRVARGGCFTDRAEPMRSDRRSAGDPRGSSSRQSRVGLRVVRNAEDFESGPVN